MNHQDIVSLILAAKNPMKQLAHFVLFDFQNLTSIDLLSSILSLEQHYITGYSVAVNI